MRVGNDLLAGARGVRIDDEDRLRGDLIERLLCDGAVDLAQVAQRHSRSVASLAGIRPALKAMADRGLVSITDARIELAGHARPYARLVAAALDAYRPLPGRFSHAV